MSARDDARAALAGAPGWLANFGTQGRAWSEALRALLDEPITDAQVEAAADAIYAHDAHGLNGVDSERLARAALEAARDA